MTNDPRKYATIAVWSIVWIVFIIASFCPLVLPFLFEIKMGAWIWVIGNSLLGLMIIALALTNMIDLESATRNLLTGDAIAALVIGFLSFGTLPGQAKFIGLLATGLFLFSIIIGLLTLASKDGFAGTRIQRGFGILYALYFIYGLTTVLWALIILILTNTG